MYIYICIFLPLGLVTHNSQLTGTMGAAARFTGLHFGSLWRSSVPQPPQVIDEMRTIIAHMIMMVINSITIINRYHHQSLNNGDPW